MDTWTHGRTDRRIEMGYTQTWTQNRQFEKIVNISLLLKGK